MKKTYAFFEFFIFTNDIHYWRAFNLVTSIITIEQEGKNVDISKQNSQWHVHVGNVQLFDNYTLVFYYYNLRYIYFTF
jgi:hypothetical protein